MDGLARVLGKFLEEHITGLINRNPNAFVRPVLVGPPQDALEALFNELTANGTSDWRVTGIGQDIVVLHVQGIAQGSTSPSFLPTLPLSKVCQWDYAVTVRNSRQLVVMLADPQAWDNRHESLANTTETLGGLGLDRRLNNGVWTYIINKIVAISGLNEGDVRSVFRKLIVESQSLEPAVRDKMLWEVTNDLLSLCSISGGGSIDTLTLSAGLPSLAGTSFLIKDALRLMDRLASYLRERGLTAGIEALKNTSVAKDNSLINFLEELSEHIRQKIFTGASFAQAPVWYYRPGIPAPGWWQSLNAALIKGMLDELQGERQDKLILRCEDALNSFDMSPGEPYIVSSEVHLRASAPEGRVVSSPSFSYKIDRTVYTLSDGASSDGSCIDSTPPLHEKPIRYQVDALGFNTGAVDILVLDTFACQGTVHIRDAERQRPPSKSREKWGQDITLPRGGPISLGVYHSSQVKQIQIQIFPQLDPTLPSVPPQPPVSKPTVTGQVVVIFVVDIESEDEVEVTLKDASGNEIGKWTTRFVVEGTSDTAQSYYEALILAHQDKNLGKVPPPEPPDYPVLRLELEYLSSSESWRPIFACWSTEVVDMQKVDWTDPCLGDTEPKVDPRPFVNPPQALLEAREVIRKSLAEGQRTFGQIYLGERALIPDVEQYLRLYREWLDNDPDQASWFDCIAVHDAQWSSEADCFIAKSEPSAILLSPLHPLRLGWHCLAQQQLFESLNYRCPAAGLLNPDTCPDIGTWYIPGGIGRIARVFFSISCENPYWLILVNEDALDAKDENIRVQRRLFELGIKAKGVVGGFSRAQTQNSLEEVTKLLPGRATLRTGIVGVSDTSSSCADGLIGWCEEIYTQEDDRNALRSNIPFDIEIYDMRGETLYPTPERLATLSEDTQEKVKWFKRDRMGPNSQLDLVILDQLGTVSPKGRDGDARSAVGYGALYRVRVREDFQNAVWLSESRIGSSVLPVSGLAGILQETVVTFEGFAAARGVSQFQFEPNRQAIGSRLEESTFLAVTSTQVDPAGIIRGAKGQKGYLWDYILPDVLGGDENSAGYYLIAEPLKAMRNAIKKTVEIVTSSVHSDSDVQGLLDEISRRGIPILKRLASGGSQSRGELGMLLAVRLLQDAFRDEIRRVNLPVWNGECIHLILPVDPYEKTFGRIRRALRPGDREQRPDLLVIAVHAPSASDQAPVHLKIVPVEVKFRSGRMNDEEMGDALRQASNLGQLLAEVWGRSALTSLWDTCSTALLVQCLNLAFRIYADEDIHKTTTAEWTKLHERVLRDVTSKRAVVEIDRSGRLLVFDDATSSAIRDTNRDGQYDTIVLNRNDAKVLLTGTGNLSPDAEASVRVLGFSLPNCDDQQSAASAGTSTAQALSLVTTTTSSSLGKEQKEENAFGSDANSMPSEIAHVPVTAFPTETRQDTISNFTPENILFEDVIKKDADKHPMLPIPRAFVGWTEPTSRWALMGKLDTTDEFVALDLDHPKTLGIFGYMGSGKSYLVGNIIEGSLALIPGINVLPNPLSVVIFNYRQNVSDRFELSSLTVPNQDATDVEKLVKEYSSSPQALRDIHVLCLPGELNATRKNEYRGLIVSELFFDPSALSIEDWELLMGEPGSGALFARTIRHVLGELQSTGDITLERLEEHTLSLLTGQSRKSAELRFKFVRKYISPTRGIKFEQVLKPGRAVIVDLRNRSLFSKEDALRFFLVCANQVNQVQRRFNKMIIFDEAHEYLSNEFGEKLASFIRLMRHNGTSYLFATQDVESIPLAIRRFIATKFVFNLGTRQNIEDLVRFAPEFKNQQLQGIRPGYCLVQTDQSVGNLFERPRLVQIRPRVTHHGGATQIFSREASLDNGESHKL